VFDTSQWMWGEVVAPSCQGMKVLDPNTKSSRELYLGNMPFGVNGPMVTEFFNAAMTQAGLSTAPGPPVVEARISEKFAFLQFRSIEETNNALQLDGIMLMGTSIKIGRPKSYTGPNIAIGGGMASALNMDLTASMLSSPFLPAMPTAASVPRATPTPILRMSNMVSKDELADDEEYGEICEDVVEELAKFGKVVRSEIPRPSSDGSEVAGLEMVFVQFEKVESATAAMDALRTRSFGGKYLGLSYFPE
jgi:hypothetical protein